MNDSFNPIQHNNETNYAISSGRYWCYNCEREFSHLKIANSEIYCPRCNCISEEISVENDPRSFKPYTPSERQHNPTESNPCIQPTPTQQPSLQNPNSENSQNSQRSNRQTQVIFVQQVIIEPEVGITIHRIQTPGTSQHIRLGSGLLGPSLFDSPLFGSLSGLHERIIEEFLRDDPNRHGPPPAPQEAIEKLPEFIFDENNAECKDCAVCQEEYKKGDKLLRLPCNHDYHKECVGRWLSMHNSCPSCRKPIQENPQ